MKINRLFACVFALTVALWSCGPQRSETEVEETATEIEPSLTQVWETPAELITNESVLFDEDADVLYVANIDGDPSGKDGKGSISKLSTSGEILNKDWVTGIDAPKGMGITNGKLYVTNIDELVEIDIASAAISNRYKLEGAKFLNDLDTHDGKVYFSDMETGKIHLFQDGKISTFAENQSSINGVRLSKNGTLYGLDGEGLKKYNSDGTFEIINATVTGGDGLVILDDNTFLASRWQGEIYLIQDGAETKLLDTKSEESNTADIDYIPSDSIILVPTFFKNKVVAYKLNY